MSNLNLLSILNDSPKAIIATVHKDPDFDAIGSLLAMRELIHALGHEVTLYAPDIDMDQFINLPGIDTLSTSVQTSYDLAIFLDCSDISRIYNPTTFPRFKVSINIDHHQDNTYFGTYNHVTNASSVGEIMANLFNSLKQPISKKIATQLYAAICFDTGNFKFSNTSPDTLRCAASLLETGISASQISEWIYENKSPTYFEDVKSGLNHLYLDTSYPFMIVHIPHSENQGKESVVNFFRSLKNIELVIICKEIEPNNYKLSFRSKHHINVAEFAQQFNGGGHIRAAGANTIGPFSELKNKMIHYAYEVFQ